MEHGEMLNLGHDDMLALLAVRLGKPLKRKVIGFRSEEVKRSLRLGADERSGLCPCFFNSVLGLPADVQVRGLPNLTVK
jgi:hypothetical protein